MDSWAREMGQGRSSCTSPVLSETYVSDPKPVEKEGDDDEEVGKRRQAVESPEALVQGFHLLRNLLWDAQWYLGAKIATHVRVIVGLALCSFLLDTLHGQPDYESLDITPW